MPGRPLAVVAAWAVLGLGLAGAWRLRRSRATVAIMVAPVALAAITTLIAFGYPRFRYAADVCLIVLAALVVARVMSVPEPAPPTHEERHQ